MRRPRIHALAAVALALSLSACGDGPCQELGERLCGCDPGATSDTCQKRVEDQLKDIDPSSALEDYCQQRLDACNAPAGAEFCEWLLTPDGKDACGLTEANPAP